MRVRGRADGWSRTVGRSPCAWCQLLGWWRSECLTFPKPVVHVYSLANFKLDQPGDLCDGYDGLGSGQRYWVGSGSHVGTGGTHNCACTCEMGECQVCTCTSDLLPLPAEEQKESWFSVPVFCVSPACRCC